MGERVKLILEGLIMKAFAAFETDIYSREKKNIIITVFSRKK